MGLALALLLNSLCLVGELEAGNRSHGARPISTNRRTLQEPLAGRHEPPSPSPPTTTPRSTGEAFPAQPVEAVQTKGLPAGVAAAFAGPASRRGQAQPEESAVQSAGLPAKSGAGPISTPAGKALPGGGITKAAGDPAAAGDPPPSPRPPYWLRGQTQPERGRAVTAGVPEAAPAAPAPAPSEISEQPARAVGIVGVPAQAQLVTYSPTPPFEIAEAAAPTDEDLSLLPTGAGRRGLRTQRGSSQRRPLHLHDPFEGPSPPLTPPTTAPRATGPATTELPAGPVQTRGLPLAASGGGAPPPAATGSFPPRLRQAQPGGGYVETGGVPAAAAPSPPPTSAPFGASQQPEEPVETAGIAPALPPPPPPPPMWPTDTVEVEAPPAGEDGSELQLEGWTAGGRGLRTQGMLAHGRGLQEAIGGPDGSLYAPTPPPRQSESDGALREPPWGLAVTYGLPEFSEALNRKPGHAPLPERVQADSRSGKLCREVGILAPAPAAPGPADLPFTPGRKFESRV
ncbi:hypothetical protein N2152v2_007822 [Parachlorella kessleri]